MQNRWRIRQKETKCKWDNRIKWKHSFVLDSDSSFLSKTDRKTNTANNIIIHWHRVIVMVIVIQSE